MLSFVYNEFLYRPILNLLIFFYNLVGGDIGIAIILVTVVIKLALHPLSLMALYKKHKVNPAGSCLPLLIQFPFLIAVYRVFLNISKPETLNQLYSFVPNPGTINPMFLNWIDMTKPFIVLAVLVGIVQYWQTKMMVHTKQPDVNGSKDESVMANMNKQMVYFMPLMTVVIGWKLPSGLILYWLVNTLLMIGQQYLFFKDHTPITAQGGVIEGEKIEDAKQIEGDKK